MHQQNPFHRPPIPLAASLLPFPTLLCTTRHSPVLFRSRQVSTRTHDTRIRFAAPRRSNVTGSFLTLMKPMSWLFSRKHWRQMLSPYLRIRPAGCVQTRLLKVVGTSLLAIYSHHDRERSHILVHTSSRVWFSLSLLHSFSLFCSFGGPRLRCRVRENGRASGARTRSASPCHRCAGASTRLNRETWSRNVFVL